MSSAHGTRRSYARGCRCSGCRAANAAYAAAQRTSSAAVTVDAAPARTHLQQLQALGLGSPRIAVLTGVSARIVRAVRLGQLGRLRASTADRLLGARASLAHGARVPATRTWRFVDSLEREGFTQREIAYHYGAVSQQLQLQPRRVRVASALRMAQLYARIAL